MNLKSLADWACPDRSGLLTNFPHYHIESRFFSKKRDDEIGNTTSERIPLFLEKAGR